MSCGLIEKLQKPLKATPGAFAFARWYLEFGGIALARESDGGDGLAYAKGEHQQVSRFLSNLFKGSDPFHAQGRTVTARDLLDAASPRIAKELQTQPAVRADLLEVMGDAYQRLGFPDRAEDMFTALIADRERVDGAGSVAVAQAYRERGDVRRTRSELSGAESDLRLSLLILDKHPDANQEEMPDSVRTGGGVVPKIAA